MSVAESSCSFFSFQLQPRALKWQKYPLPALLQNCQKHISQFGKHKLASSQEDVQPQQVTADTAQQQHRGNPTGAASPQWASPEGPGVLRALLSCADLALPLRVISMNNA